MNMKTTVCSFITESFLSVLNIHSCNQSLPVATPTLAERLNQIWFGIGVFDNLKTSIVCSGFDRGFDRSPRISNVKAGSTNQSDSNRAKPSKDIDRGLINYQQTGSVIVDEFPELDRCISK